MSTSYCAAPFKLSMIPKICPARQYEYASGAFMEVRPKATSVPYGAWAWFSQNWLSALAVKSMTRVKPGAPFISSSICSSDILLPW